MQDKLVCYSAQEIAMRKEQRIEMPVTNAVLLTLIAIFAVVWVATL